MSIIKNKIISLLILGTIYSCSSSKEANKFYYNCKSLPIESDLSYKGSDKKTDSIFKDFANNKDNSIDILKYNLQWIWLYRKA